MSDIGMTEILALCGVIEQEYDYALWCAEKTSLISTKENHLK